MYSRAYLKLSTHKEEHFNLFAALRCEVEVSVDTSSITHSSKFANFL